MSAAALTFAAVLLLALFIAGLVAVNIWHRKRPPTCSQEQDRVPGDW